MNLRLPFLAIAITAISGCGDPPKPSAEPLMVSVVTARAATVPVTLQLPGRTHPSLVAQVRARVDGIVLKREYAEGTLVKAGERLYLIDPAPYQAQLQNAAANLQKAQANLVAMKAQAARYEPLVAINAVSKQDYDNAVSHEGQAQAEVASGQAQAEIARINLGYTSVTSPITGRSGISHVTQGAYVQGSQATLMTTIQQIDPMHVDLTQSSLQGLELRRDAAQGRLKLAGIGQATVTVTMEDGRSYPHKGRVEFSDITVDQTTGAVTVRAVMPNPESTLLPGMFVRATIHAGHLDNVYLVPQAGITRNSRGEATALIVDRENKVASRVLQVRGTNGSNWVVDGGLGEGDRVIVAGVQKVRPGSVVRTTELAPPIVAKTE